MSADLFTATKIQSHCIMVRTPIESALKWNPHIYLVFFFNYSNTGGPSFVQNLYKWNLYYLRCTYGRPPVDFSLEMNLAYHKCALKST